MKRGVVEERESCPSPTESRPSMWKIHLCFRREAFGELTVAGELSSQKEVPVQGAEVIFCLLTDNCNGSNGKTALTAGPETRLLPMHPAKSHAQGQNCAGTVRSLW